MKRPSDYSRGSEEAMTWRWPKEFEEEANAEAHAAIERFLGVLHRHEPATPRQKAERRGLRVIEGGKTK